MSFLSALTIIFVVCKILGFITWSWWIVFSPALVGLAFLLILFVLAFK